MVVNKIDTEQIQTDYQYYYDWENQVYLDPPVSPESEVDTTPYLSAPINPTQIAQAPSELTLSALGIGKAEKMMVAYLEGKGGTEEKVVEAYSQIYELLLILEEQYGDQPGVAKKLQALRKELYQRLAETAERFGAKGRALVKNIAARFVALENTYVECAKVVTIIMKGEKNKSFAHVSLAVKTDAQTDEKQEVEQNPARIEAQEEDASAPTSSPLTSTALPGINCQSHSSYFEEEVQTDPEKKGFLVEFQQTLAKLTRQLYEKILDRILKSFSQHPPGHVLKKYYPFVEPRSF